MVHSEHEGAPPDMDRTYRVRRPVSAGADSRIEDAAGRSAFLVDGTTDSASRVVTLRAADGADIYHVDQRLRIRDTIEIEGAGGIVATVRKALVPPLRERVEVTLADGGRWAVEGRISDHEYQVMNGVVVVAEVSRRWTADPGEFGIRVGLGADDALVVLITIAIASITSPVA